jgi:hypothetical protein
VELEGSVRMHMCFPSQPPYDLYRREREAAQDVMKGPEEPVGGTVMSYGTEPPSRHPDCLRRLAGRLSQGTPRMSLSQNRGFDEDAVA